MNGWKPSPWATGMATRASTVDAVIHGTKKWRTKALAAIRRTEPEGHEGDHEGQEDDGAPDLGVRQGTQERALEPHRVEVDARRPVRAEDGQDRQVGQRLDDRERRQGHEEPAPPGDRRPGRLGQE